MDTKDPLQLIRYNLGLTKSDLPDDDLSVALQSLLVAASRDGPDARYTLQRIYQVVSALALVGDFDVFSAVPVILSSSRDGADDLLFAIADGCSPKETVVVLQECAERLTNRLQYAEENEEESSDIEHSSEDTQRLSTARQVIRILHTYSRVIPRLPKGKKSLGQILESPLSQLQRLLHVAASAIGNDDVIEVMRALIELIVAISKWRDVPQKQAQEEDVKGLVYSLVSSVLEAYGSKLDNDVARRAYEAQFPRLVLPGSTSQSVEADVINDLRESLQSFAIDVQSRSSLSSLILLAHTPGYTPSLPALQPLLPVLLTSIQTNIAIPETLAILLTALGPLRTTPQHSDSPPDLLLPLAHILPHLAGAHPDPELRHITFRLLSLVLSLLPSELRLHILHDILGEDEVSPQMRIAAIGLVKEAVLGALTPNKNSADTNNAFASPLFMRTFAPLIFTSHLPGVNQGADAEDDLEAFLESPEPLRLVESLGLYYVVLQRDVGNKTGVRDADAIKSVQKVLIGALRDRLSAWSEIDLGEEEDAKLQLAILDMWLDRITVAVDDIHTL